MCITAKRPSFLNSVWNYSALRLTRTTTRRRINNLSLRLCNASLEENRSCVSEDSPKSTQPRDSEVDEIGKRASRASLCTNNRIDHDETERKPDKQSNSTIDGGEIQRYVPERSDPKPQMEIRAPGERTVSKSDSSTSSLAGSGEDMAFGDRRRRSASSEYRRMWRWFGKVLRRRWERLGFGIGSDEEWENVREKEGNESVGGQVKLISEILSLLR